MLHAITLLALVSVSLAEGSRDEPVAREEASQPGSSVESSAESSAAVAGEGARLEAGRLVGSILERTWTARPEWAEMALAILKEEAMEPGKGWWRPSRSLYGWEWLARFDANSDGKVARTELAGAEDLFERLDRDADGLLSAADFAPPEEPRGGEALKALFGKLDHDSNGRISWDELSWFFQEADRAKRGFLSLADLDAAVGKAFGPPPPEEREEMPSRAKLLSLLFRGDLGSFGEGPGLGDTAPELKLPLLEGEGEVKLSDLRGKKPVVLVFGSFT